MSDFLNCPKCGSSSVKKVQFTWWGGALGPALLTHVQCQGCGNQYNGKTGRSNASAIAVYLVVATGVVAILVFFLTSRL
jgi:transposase-like protein